jgi:starch phosphorylase
MQIEPMPLARYIRVLTGRPPDTATKQEWLRAIAAMVRDLVPDRRVLTASNAPSDGSRRICYLSMEFLPGRLLTYALRNLGLYDSCNAALAEHGHSLIDLADAETDPALGNGGLGRLAACLLDATANLGMPAHGYGIRYDFGLFTQQIESGWQVEKPDRWLERGNPWEIPRREFVHAVKFGGQVTDGVHHGVAGRQWVETTDMLAMAYDMPVLGYHSPLLNTLRLWSPQAGHELDLGLFNDGDHHRAFARRNAIESLSQILYPSDSTPAGRELRFSQEFFFVSASVQDILRRFMKSERSFDRLPDTIVIQVNDTHPALAIAELMRLLVDIHHLGWSEAWDITRRCFAYTNHTLMPEALEVWPVGFFERLLPRHLEIIYDINAWFLKRVERRHPGDLGLLRRVSLVEEDGERKIRMAHLAVVGSRKVNGVSKMHTGLMRETIFRDFDDLYPGKIINITNGVTFQRWLHSANPELTALIRGRLGDDWLSRPAELAKLAPHAEDPDFRARFRAVKRQNKEILARLIQRDCHVAVDIDSLFDVQVKRLHEYKRQLLKLLHVVWLYDRLRQGGSAVPRTVIFAGKAAPGYAMAKLIIKLIHDVAAMVNADPAVNGTLKLVFIPDYSVGKAEQIIPATDLSEQISTAGYEASGTGNMKLALNGALTIGTLDGANIEIRDAVGPENFFVFGATAEAVVRARADSSGYDRTEAMKALDLIASGHFSPDAPRRFQPIVDALTIHGDPYFVLGDFASYLHCQEQVEAVFRDPDDWSRRAILNIAGASGFSSDRAVQDYADRVWFAPGEQNLPAEDASIRAAAG